jgi:hypothetical protein
MSGISESSGYHITVSNNVASSDTAIARRALKDVCGVKNPEAAQVKTTVAKLWGINKKHLKKVGAYRTLKKLANADHRSFSRWRSTKQIFVNRSICPPPKPKIQFLPCPKPSVVKQKPCPKVEKKPVKRPIKRPIKKPVKPPIKGTKKPPGFVMP